MGRLEAIGWQRGRKSQRAEEAGGRGHAACRVTSGVGCRPQAAEPREYRGQRRDIWRAEPAGGRASGVSRGAGATGAGRVVRIRGGSSPKPQRQLLTGVADSSCPEQETGASRPRAAAPGRREACGWGCSSAGGDTRPSSGGTQRRRRRPQRPGRGPDLPSERGCSRSLQAPPPPPPRRAGARPKPRRPPLPGPLPGPAAAGIAAPPSPPASGLVRPPPLRPRRRRRRRPRRSSPRPPRLLESPAPSLPSTSFPPPPPPLRPLRGRFPPPTRAPCHSSPRPPAARTRASAQASNGPIGTEDRPPCPAPHGLGRSSALSALPHPSLQPIRKQLRGRARGFLPRAPVLTVKRLRLATIPKWPFPRPGSSAPARGGGRGRAVAGRREDKTDLGPLRAHLPPNPQRLRAHLPPWGAPASSGALASLTSGRDVVPPPPEPPPSCSGLSVPCAASSRGEKG